MIGVQWAFAAAPGHPLLKSVLDAALPRVIAQNTEVTERYSVYHITGTGVWTAGLTKVLLHGLDIAFGMTLDQVREVKDFAWRQQGLCILTREGLIEQLANEYASQGNGFLESADWSSWTKERDELIAARTSLQPALHRAQ